MTCMSHDIINITVITVKDADCCCVIYGLSKSEATYLLENFVLNDRGFIENAFPRNSY